MVENTRIHFPDKYKNTHRKPKRTLNQETQQSNFESNLPCLESEEAPEDVSNIVLNTKEEEENFTMPHITTQNSSQIRLSVVQGED